MQLYKYDTHVHTSQVSPCGKVRGAEVVQLYKEAGYHGIIITDHYNRNFFESLGDMKWSKKIDAYLSGYREAYKEGEKIGLHVLLGIELRFTDSANEYLVYGIDEEFLKREEELFNKNLSELRNLVKDLDVVVIQAHPFRKGMTLADPALLDGLEVYNGNPRHNSRNDEACAYAKEKNLKMLSGSDFHQIEDLARGGILLSRPIQSSRELVELLENDEIVALIKSE